jgi:hypothetical protein
MKWIKNLSPAFWFALAIFILLGLLAYLLVLLQRETGLSLDV